MYIMKVKVEIPIMRSINTWTRASWNRSVIEYVYQNLKDGELYLNRVKLEETLVETCSDSDMQINCQIWVQGQKTN